MGWKRFFRRRYWDRESAMELDSYVAHETQENINRGMSPAEAESRARRKLGNAVKIREEIYDWNSLKLLDVLWRDAHCAVRTLRQRPLSTAAIVLTFAVGIGAAAVIFSIVDPVLLRPLPYENPDRLTVIWATLNGQPSDQKLFASYTDYEEFRDHSVSFEDIAANTWARAGSQILTWRGEPHEALAIPATPNLFSLLGAKAVVGRTFDESDLANGCTIVLAHRFWRNLGAAPEIAGAGVTLGERSCTVIGVMDSNFEFFPKQTDVWTLIAPDGPFSQDPASSVAIFARLRPGVTRAAADREVVLLHKEVARKAPASSWVHDIVPHVYDLQGEFTFLAGANLRRGLWLLVSAVGILLLIACMNIAGLLLIRGAEREKDAALRVALGCGRIRMISQLLLESLFLAGAGALLAVALAALGIRYFHTVHPIDLPPGNPVVLNWTVFGFAALSGVITGLLSGLFPAFKTSRMDVNELLKGTGPTVASAWSSRKAGKALVLIEITLSMVLLVGAALLIESIDQLMSVPLGFRTDHLITARLRLPPDDYADPAKRSRFYESVLAELRALPGIIDGVALSSDAPLSGFESSVVTVPGRPAPDTELGDVGIEQVSRDFTSVLGIPLLKGRPFGAGDHESAAPVAIVNQKFAEEYFGDEDPVGKQIKPALPSTAGPWLTIIGIVGNVKRGDFFKEMGYRTPPMVYRPLSQSSTTGVSILIRTKIESKDLAGLVHRSVSKLDARVVTNDFSSFDDLVSKNLAQPRFRTVLLGIFAGIALLLAAIGLYALLMQAVVQRTREIGIRIAVGAERGRIIGMIVRQGAALSAVGISAGGILSIALSGFLSRMLFGVAATDPGVLLLTAAVLFSIALIAAYLPARRAARIDPILAIKHE